MVRSWQAFSHYNSPSNSAHLTACLAFNQSIFRPLPSFAGPRLPHLTPLPSFASRRRLHFCSFKPLSRLTLSHSYAKAQKVTPLLSHFCALFQNEYSSNQFIINNLRTLCKNTGGDTPKLGNHDQRATQSPVTFHPSRVAGSLPLATAPQIFTQHHSFEYGTRLIRYPDFTPVTT